MPGRPSREKAGARHRVDGGIFRRDPRRFVRAPASLGAVVGAWPSLVNSGSYGNEAEVVMIAESGAITMNNPLGCDSTGTITPDAAHGFYHLSVR